MFFFQKNFQRLLNTGKKLFTFLLICVLALLTINEKNSGITNWGFSQQPTSVQSKRTTQKFSRKKHFGSWKDLDKDRLNTRYEILFREAAYPFASKNGVAIDANDGVVDADSMPLDESSIPIDQPAANPLFFDEIEKFPKSKAMQRKMLHGNSWQSDYSRVKIFHFEEAGRRSSNLLLNSLEIDHSVSLKEAWRSGACLWSQQKRVMFLNAEHDGNLVVSDSWQNRSKGSQDLSKWLPHNPEMLEDYLNRWIAVKLYWGLIADLQELETLSLFTQLIDVEKLSTLKRLSRDNASILQVCQD